MNKNKGRHERAKPVHGRKFDKPSHSGTSSSTSTSTRSYDTYLPLMLCFEQRGRQRAFFWEWNRSRAKKDTARNALESELSLTPSLSYTLQHTHNHILNNCQDRERSKRWRKEELEREIGESPASRRDAACTWTRAIRCIPMTNRRTSNDNTFCFCL